MKHNFSKMMKVLLAFILVCSTFVGLLPSISTKVSANNTVDEVEKEESYTQYVDPFVCTDVDYGQLFPGSVVPNGLVKLSPDTYPHDTLDHAGYDYSKLKIQGFSHTRIEGVGGQGAGGDILVTPTYVQYSERPTAASRAMSYSKDNESAKPGYYSVELTPNVGSNSNVSANASLGNIKAELTSDQRTGYHRYTFPSAGQVSIITDLNYTYHGTDIRDAILEVLEESTNTTAIGGRFSGKNVSGYGKYTMYFYMETNKPATSVKTWNGSALSEVKSQAGNDLGAIFTFNVEDNEAIELKVSISPISVEQAKIDMHNEITGWNFNDVYKKADQTWNDVLGKVRVESSANSDPTGELKKLFYTHLYHMFMTPVNATSTSNTYRGTDGKIYEANDYVHYDSWTLWDDYRKYAMIGLIMPETYKDMIQSIADALNTGIATWSHNLQPVPNVRTEHAVSLLADGIAKGYLDIDGLQGAYEAAKRVANNAITSSVEAQGYFSNRVDRTAEYAYDDWCLSIVADALGLEDESAYYLDRSMNYKNIFRKDIIDSPFSENKLGLLWNKSSNGSWSSSSPTKIGADSLYQGSMWQYTWYDSNDINGLMELMGGEQTMLEALMYMFGMQDTSNGSLYLHNAANEVELNLPYFFNYVGRADLTQYWIRKIYTDVSYNTGYASGNIEAKMYKLAPDGYLETMDDDAGTMAMMFVSSAMGIFAMTPGDPTFQIGTPFFDKMTLDVGNGKAFTIVADGVSADNYYIQSATFNGEKFNRTWIDYSEITNGGVLYFNMGNTPSDWGKGSVTAPSSSDYAPTSYSDNDAIQYSTGTFVESDESDGSIANEIEITINGTTFIGDVNDDLVDNGTIIVTHLPEGLSAKAVKTEDSKVVLSLEGKAVNHSTNDSVSNVVVTISENAVVDKNAIADSVRGTKNNIRITFNNDALHYSLTKLNENVEENGTIDGTVTISLSGNTTFSGSVNEDFISTGKVNVTNVPNGLSAKIVKKNDTTLELSFVGYAYNEDYDANVGIYFTNEAFNGTSANTIKNSSLSGMNAFVLDFFKDYKEALTSKIEEAENVDVDDYGKTSYDSLMNKIEEAKTLLTNAATETEMKNMITELIYAMEKLVLKEVKNPTDKLETEKPDTITSEANPVKGAIKLESINLGNTFDGAWIGYYNVDFSVKEIDSIDIRYSGSNNCASDASVEVHLDSISGPIIATVSIPPTGSWSNWSTVNAKITDTDGVHDVYFVLKGTTDPSSRYYIANIDYIQFKEKELSKPVISTEFVIDCEKDYDEFHGGEPLKVESVNIGGSRDDAWVKFKDINFSTLDVNSISVYYAANNCRLDGRLEFYIDELSSTPIAIMDVPKTNNWSNYVTMTQRCDFSKVKGTHDVIVKYVGKLGSGLNIANLDWIKFTKESNYKVQFEQGRTEDDWSSDGKDYYIRNSGKGLKVEYQKSTLGEKLIYLGGSYKGAWAKYEIDFDLFEANTVTVHYSAKNNCKEDATLKFYLDSMENDPFVSVKTPRTGDWNIFNTVSASFNEMISGKHTVYVEFTGEDTTQSNICNPDWFEFSRVGKVDSHKIEFESVVNSSAPYWSEKTINNGSSDVLKTETKNGISNVGGTYHTAWLKYDNINFDEFAAGEVVVNYVNNSNRCKPDATIHFHLDSVDNDPFVSVSLPATGSSWDTYKEIVAQIPKSVSGTHTLYVSMSGTEGNNPYIANLDYFIFRKANSYKIEFEKAKENWSGNSLKTEVSTDNSGKSLTNVGGSYVGAWLKYENIDFDSIGANELVVRYSGKGSNTNKDAKLHFYLDSMEGTPFATIEIPPTANNGWSNYVETTKEIEKNIYGTHTVYVVMDGSNTSKYVGNLDWFAFNFKEKGQKSDVSELNEAVASAKQYIGIAELYEVEGISRLEYLVEDAQKFDENDDQQEIDTYKQYVTNGISLLVYRVIHDLEQLIERCESLVKSNYTDASLALLVNPLQNAKQVSESRFDLTMYKNAYDELNTAVAGLVKIGNKTKLNTVLNNATSLNEIDYVSTGWAILETAVEEAKDVIEKDKALQEEIDVSVIALKEAMNNLVKRGDKTVLNTLVNEIIDEQLDYEDFTEDSYDVLKDSLNNAQNVLANKDALQDEIDEAKETLENAYEELVNISDLIDLIFDADTLLGEDVYTEVTKDALNDAMENATGLLDDGTKDEVDDAEEDLKVKMNALIPVGELPKTIEDAEKVLAEGTYTTTSTNALKEAIEDAKEALKSATTANEIEIAKQSMKDAKGELVDIATLKQLVKDAADVNLSDYTDASAKAFEKALADAQKAMVNGTDESVKAAEDAILATYRALVNVTSLNEVIERVESVDTKLYTDASAKAFVDAYNAACKARVEGTAKEVEEAEKALADAYNALEKIEAYKIVEGMNANWATGSGKDLVFKADGDFAKFVCVEIDDKVLDKKHYTAKAGSTIVTISEEYLSTLSVGEHKLTVVYRNGEASCAFTVSKVNAGSTGGSNTGDTTNVGGLLAMLIASMAILLGKRKRA